MQRLPNVPVWTPSRIVATAALAVLFAAVVAFLILMAKMLSPAETHEGCHCAVECLDRACPRD